MSLMHPYDVTDRDGVRHATTLADCLNIARTPAARQQVLDRTLHRLEAAGQPMQVEKAFFYLDTARGQAFLVQPPRERFRYAEASALLDRMLAVLPEAMRAQVSLTRVVFGLEELREKIVAAEAGLDDRAVELMKAAVLHDHPVLLQKPRLRLALDRVDAQGATFIAQYDHSPKTFSATYGTPELLADDTKTLHAWSRTMDRHDLYKLPARGDHWVNYRRWVPSQDAVAELHAVVGALAKGAKGSEPKPASKAFQSMLGRLPRGSSLSGQGKQDLRKLFLWAKKKGLQKLEDQLFELRFGVELEDSWYRNDDKNDIDTLWRLLKNLPESHVEGNVKLAEISLGRGGGGSFSPSTLEIEIGSQELAFKERFEDTLRHEVGHAVHEAHTDLVNGWLWERFGWASFDPARHGAIDDWARLMGPAWGRLPAAQQTQMRALIRQACGAGGVWGPTVTPQAPAGSPWKAPDFGPRLAFENSGDSWYENNARWYRVGGKAFALNFWYATLMCVDVATLDFINGRMPDRYAAMSPGEFFAEIYALYFDRDDPRRKAIPADVAKWLDTNLTKAAPTRTTMPRSLKGGKARPGREAVRARTPRPRRTST